MIRPVRYAVLAFVVVGALSIGVAVDWSTPHQAPVPVIELRSGASPDASREPSSPTLKARHSGRNLIRIRLPKIQRPRPARAEPREDISPRTSSSAVPTEPDSGASSEASGDGEARPRTSTTNQDDDQATGRKTPKSPVPPANPGTPETTAGGAAAAPPPLPAPAGESSSDDWGDDDDDDGDDEEDGDGGDDDGDDD